MELATLERGILLRNRMNELQNKLNNIKEVKTHTMKLIDSHNDKVICLDTEDSNMIQTTLFLHWAKEYQRIETELEHL